MDCLIQDSQTSWDLAIGPNSFPQKSKGQLAVRTKTFTWRYFAGELIRKEILPWYCVSL